MCNVCCHEFGGWCKAFTKTERLLTIIECILLVFFFIFLTFLILHLLVCPTVEYPTPIDEGGPSNSNEIPPIGPSPSRPTVGPHVKCTWEPSKKTEATTHYYEFDHLMKSITTQAMAKLSTPKENNTDFDSNTLAPSALPLFEDDDEDLAGVEESDGENPEPGFEKFVIALVKIKPMRDITFGCILTVVSDHWTLTAASCIDAIEEVDSLDSFVMMEGYGAGEGGRTHAVGDVRVHPLYGGANRSYDVAALRSEDRLAPGPSGFPRLPDVLDYLLLTMGERLVILGYGKFRSVQTRSPDRSVREVHVYKLPQQACGEERPDGVLRHLTRPEPVRQGACGAAAVCAGSLHSRGVPCNYCSGTPLLHAGRLLGVMADNQQCGVACEPARYVNLATLRDWLDAVLSDRSD